MVDITPIIKAVATLIGAIITVVVVPYIKSRTTAQQRAELLEWVNIAVAAAEQIYQGSGRGAEKKTYVRAWLASHGVTVDADELDAIIEAAVYHLGPIEVNV